MGKQAGGKVERSTLSSGNRGIVQRKCPHGETPYHLWTVLKKHYLAEAELYHFLYCQYWCSFHGQIFHPLLFASWGREQKFDNKTMAPFRLRLFPPVVKSKHNGERVCSHQFTIFVEAVGCRDHPGASNLMENKFLESTLTTRQQKLPRWHCTGC